MGSQNSGYKKSDQLFEYNNLYRLREIARQYWPTYSQIQETATEVAFDRFEKAFFKDQLKLVRGPSKTTYAEPCSICGGISYSLYGPRNNRLQCVTCRSFVFPKSLAVSTSVRNNMSVNMMAFGIPCLAKCDNALLRKCILPPSKIYLDEDGKCAQLINVGSD